MIKNKKSQIDSTMMIIGVSIILFWLAVFTGMTMLRQEKSSSFNSKDTDFSNVGLNKETVTKMFDLVGKTITFDIPNIPFALRFFFIFLEILSFAVLIVIIIGIVSSFF